VVELKATGRAGFDLDALDLNPSPSVSTGKAAPGRCTVHGRSPRDAALFQMGHDVLDLLAGILWATAAIGVSTTTRFSTPRAATNRSLART